MKAFYNIAWASSIIATILFAIYEFDKYWVSLTFVWIFYLAGEIESIKSDKKNKH
tara:strand:- start:1 stop:165 length:165 start_codon:yes stop_codon:yes gene_type:complete